MVLRCTVRGTKIYLPDGVTEYIPHWYNWNRSVLPGDAALCKSWGADGIRITPNWGGGQTSLSSNDLYDPTTVDFLNAANMANLDAQIQQCVAAGMWVCIGLSGGDDPNNLFWTDATVRSQFITSWTSIINKYKNTDYIFCYEFLTEVSPFFGTQHMDQNNAAVLAMYLQLTAVAGGLDPATLWGIGAAKNYALRNLPACYDPSFVNKSVVFFNCYELTAYVKSTKQGNSSAGYPGIYPDTRGNQANTGETYPQAGSSTVTADKTFYAGLLQICKDFSNQYNLPVFCDQIGIRSGVKDSYAYTRDICDILISLGIGFAWWTFRQPYGSSSFQIDDLGMYYQTSDGVWHAKDGTQTATWPDSQFNWLGMMQSKFAGIQTPNPPSPVCLMAQNIGPVQRDFTIWNSFDYLRSWRFFAIGNSGFAMVAGVSFILTFLQDGNEVLVLPTTYDLTTSGVSFDSDFLTSGNATVLIKKADIQNSLAVGEYDYTLKMYYNGIYQETYAHGTVTVEMGVGT